MQIFFLCDLFFLFPFCTLHATFTYFAYFLFFWLLTFQVYGCLIPPPPPPPSPFHPPLFNINRKQCYVIKISEIPGRPRLYSPLGFSGLPLPSYKGIYIVYCFIKCPVRFSFLCTLWIKMCKCLYISFNYRMNKCFLFYSILFF